MLIRLVTSLVRVWRRHPAPVAAAVYAVLALGLVAQGLLPGRALTSADYLWSAPPWAATAPADVRENGANGELADAVSAFLPFSLHARDRLPAPPLWNPHVMGGRPFLANAQSAVLSPFSLPLFVLPFWTALALAAAFGGFLLARALGARAPGAMLAGLAYGFSLWLVTWLAWPLASVWALLPWVLWLVDRVVRAPGAGAVAALAGVVALQFFAGHPESSFHLGVAAVLFALLRLSRRPEGRARAGGAVLAGLAAGTALAAVVLVPLLELLVHSADWAQRAEREPGHTALRHVAGLALPEWWGRPTQVMSIPYLNARAFYAGGLPLLLAGLAVALRPSRERVALAATGLLALAVALGIPPFFQLVTALPGFAAAENTRLPVLTVLAVALLAGLGLDDLLARRWPWRRAAVLLAVAVALPVLAVVAGAPWRAQDLDRAVAVAAAVAEPVRADVASVAPLAAMLLWLAFAGGGALLVLAVLRGRLPPALAAGAVFGLVALDLARAGVGQNPAIPLDHARQPATGAIRFLQDQGTARFAGLLPRAGLPPLPADEAMRWGLYDARGYDYPVEARYDRLWRSAVAPRLPFIPPATIAGDDPRALRALGLLGVTSLVARPADPARPLPMAYDGADARVYANPQALPRTWIAGGEQVVEGEEAALAAVLAPGFDARGTVVTERPLGLRGGGRPAGRARIVRYEPERVEIAAAATAPGVVVLSDVHYPGWTARVDGRETQIERVDYLLRGVRVQPGAHRIELRYEPASVRLGALVSALALGGLAAAVLLARRRRGAA